MKEIEPPLFTLLNISISIHNINKKLERSFGLSLVQWCVLLQISENPCISANTLSNFVGVHPSSLTQTLKRLERKRMIIVTEDPLDSRKKVISITKAGHTRTKSLEKSLESWISSLYSETNTLEKLKKNLSNNSANLEIKQY